MRWGWLDTESEFEAAIKKPVLRYPSCTVDLLMFMIHNCWSRWLVFVDVLSWWCCCLCVAVQL